jgi:hypothetical protein
MLGQLREGAGMPLTQTLETERLRFSEWQGGGFDTTRLREERTRLEAGDVGG